MDTGASLQMKDISNAFLGVQALGKVSLAVHAGDILGLISENGAGQSTLMKILSDVSQMDEDHLLLDGQTIPIQNPHLARQTRQLPFADPHHQGPRRHSVTSR